MWHWRETFVAGMLEMVEVVKNRYQQEWAVYCLVFGYAGSATGVTSLTHFALNCINMDASWMVTTSTHGSIRRG